MDNHPSFLVGGVMPILQVENLSKHYGKNEQLVKALDGITFSVEKGEFVAIVGASGSGKSTLLHLIGGVDKPTSGKIVVDGVDITTLKEEQLAKYRREKTSIIYQFYNLIPVLNIRENMEFPVLLDGKTVDEDFLNELIEVLNLQDRTSHLPNELSGGEQQRVAIGRALLIKPNLLLADEATGNLDSKATHQILELLTLTNQKYQQTILMVTHDLELARYASRIITIKDGKIIADERIMKNSNKTSIVNEPKGNINHENSV